MLKDKKILVIGAAGLLGIGLVKQLLIEGAEVVAVDINIDVLEKHLNSLDGLRYNAAVTFVNADFSKKKQVQKLFEDVGDSLTGAVNCAYPRNENYGKHFFDVDVNDFNENVSINLGSSFLFMQECARYFKSNNNDFSLVNISSIYGVIAPKFELYSNTDMTTPVEYSAIKSALIHLSRYVIKYVSDSRFRVNLVSPGGIYDEQPGNFLDAYKQETFGEGMLDVADILGSIIFLLSSASRFVNGQNIIVDDGFSI
ncbi:MAG: flagellin modification protein A [Legionellales bacterium]|nr:flagellin modification protein A [Legionellales bacterium]